MIGKLVFMIALLAAVFMTLQTKPVNNPYKEMQRTWGNYTIYNCGSESQVFQKGSGDIYCGNVAPFKCSPYVNDQYSQVCGKCVGICNGARPESLKCGATVDRCNSCVGYYAPNPC